MTEMNVNIAKARAIVGMVAGSTTVDESYLLEDDTFCALLTDYAHQMTLSDAVERLSDYVNENY